MTDVHTPEQRSYNMSRIRGRDTKPELTLRKALWSKGLRYRKTSRLAGRPDIIFPGKRLAVFVDGCFWHACPEHFQWPKSNEKFWRDKLGRNIERDRSVDQKLADLGWDVIRVWEHEIEEDLQRVVERIVQVHFRLVNLKLAGRPNSALIKTGFHK